MLRASDGNGGEFRAVSLAVYIATIGMLLSLLTAVGSYALGQREERGALFDKMEQRFELKDTAQQVHEGLSARIADGNREIGLVRGRLDAHLDGILRSK